MPSINNKAQKGRFLLVGAAATTIDFGILFLLRFGLQIAVVPANIGSTSLAFCFSFFANKKYTFKSDGQSLLRQMALFTVVTLFGLWVIQGTIIHLIMPLITSFLSESSLALFVSKLLATAATLLWNYLLYSRIVFKKS